MRSQPGKEFEIKKRLDRLRGKSRFGRNNNNNNNNNKNNSGDNGPDLFGLGGASPPIATIEDFLDGGPPPPPPPPTAPFNLGNNLFQPNNTEPVPPPDFNVIPAQTAPPNISTTGIGSNLFGSQAATAVRENKTKTQQEVDDFLYELPDNMPELELEDGLLETLGTEAEDLFDPRAPPTKKEEEDEILKDLIDEYNSEDLFFLWWRKPELCKCS